MGRPRTVNCVACGKHIDEVGPLSARKKCEACSIGLQVEAIESIADGRGATFNKYVTGVLRYASTLNNAAATQTTTNGTPSPTDPPQQRNT